MSTVIGRPPPARTAAPRKGASRQADMAPDLRAALSRGELPSATLSEVLAVDQACLLRNVFPALWPQLGDAVQAACTRGIAERMRTIGSLLQREIGAEGWALCSTHTSDTVRGWACFMLGAPDGMPLAQRLDAIRPLADDAHFGVREWAWLAVRPHVAVALDPAIAALAGWTGAPSERLRRFASEVLRPRGVWCAHLAPLKHQPERALPVLTPLRADPSAYVQHSVGNWLNDAGKDQPDWVRTLCREWLAQSPAAATQRICARALRHLS